MKILIKKIKFFFDIIVKSLTKFEYYKEIAKAKFSFSLKYLFFLFYITSLIGSLAFAGSLAVLVAPKIPEFVASFESKANSIYPSGLVVNIKDGNLSTNQKEPYFVDTLKMFDLGEDYDHVLTIDTKADESMIKDYKTFVLITKNSFVSIKDKNSYQVSPIDESITMTIDEKSYKDLVAQITPYLKYVQGGFIALIVLSIFVLPILGASFGLIGQLIYLLIFTSIFFIVVKFMKKKITFKKLFQLAIHASTLPILLGLIVSSIGISMPFLLGSAILFVFMILVINQF